MKKILTLSICTLALFFCFNLDVHASEIHIEEIQIKDFETNAYAPITRWWYETPPIKYRGRHMYFSTQINKQCLDGYLSASNVGLGYHVYRGYLYPCNGPKPIPIKVGEEEY